jgi:hypothetical protein
MPEVFLISIFTSKSSAITFCIYTISGKDLQTCHIVISGLSFYAQQLIIYLSEYIVYRYAHEENNYP